MNQYGNFISSNLFSVLILSWVIYLVSFIQTNTFLHVMVTIVILATFLALSLATYKALGYDSHYEIPPIVSPFVLIVSLFLGVMALQGKVKVIRSSYHKVFAYYHHGDITIFYYHSFKVQLLDEMPFNGEDSESEELIKLIDEHRFRGKLGSKNSFNFTQWDGTLDKGVKRKETIKDIIK